MEFLIVTGLSGAGKTQAAHFLEDLGYYCVDNMPAALLVPFARFGLDSRGRFDKVALVTDIRAQKSFDELFSSLDQLRNMDCPVHILYIEAPVPVIVRRYKETRRRHPLGDPSLSIEGAVRKEMELMAPVRERADYIIDTGSTTLGQLHREICALFVEGGNRALPIQVMAFGYKYGIPLEADLVFDVRFLPNPYYIDELRGMTGFFPEVYNYVMNSEDAKNFSAQLCSMIDFLIPRYQAEGKQSLTIAIGCTGGRHRSVTIARVLTDHLLEAGQNVRLISRDTARGSD